MFLNESMDGSLKDLSNEFLIETWGISEDFQKNLGILGILEILEILETLDFFIILEI